MIFQIETKDPCGVARKMLAVGALPDDELEMLRNGRSVMKGSIGWFAARRVRENEKHFPTFVKWRPFLMTRSPSETASDDLEAP